MQITRRDIARHRRRRPRDRCRTARLGRLGAEPALPGSRRSRSSTRASPSIALYNASVERLADRHALGRGPGLVRRRPLPALERHPQQPHHALGRGDRRRQRLPQAVEQRQRQHPRPPGPAASPASTTTRRVTRTEYDGTHHGADRQVRRQAAQLAERHRGQVRRLDLVHRSAVRHPRQLRGARRQAGTADQRLPARSQDRTGDGRGGRRQPAERARVLARRDEALHRRGSAPTRA